MSKRETLAKQHDYVAGFYGSDIDKCLMEVQLKTLGVNIDRVTEMFDIREYHVSLSSGERSLLYEVTIFMKHISSCLLPILAVKDLSVP